ncbi:hypothetical protein CMO92_03365 [Candidatus Woesearchaeota archaeon]|nr:hypothetical protein [Candidatus Woesearchaeota archaeon]
MISVWNNRAYRRVLDLDLREDAAIAIGSLERVHFPKRTEYAAVIQPHPRVPYELVMTWEGFFITGENSKVFDRFPCSFDVESGEAYKGNRVPVHMHSGVLSLDKDPKVLGPMGCGM